MELEKIIRLLLSHGSGADNLSGAEIRQTHISYILLTQDLVYKIKKPVNFGFLDFTSLEKREFFCRQEVILNRRLTNNVYIDAVPVKRLNHSVSFGGEGKTVEYAVKMRRLPENKMMNRLLEEGKISVSDVKRIARFIAKFHRSEVTDGDISVYGSPENLLKNLFENFKQTETAIGKTISENQFEKIYGYARETLREKKAVFEKRVREGWIKNLHGDIHSDHVCLSSDIQIFDCIEFNKRFRCIDTIADAGFLAMDLDFYNRHDLSSVFTGEYIEHAQDPYGEALLNYYKLCKSYVRGKVESFKLFEDEISDSDKTDSYIRAMRYNHLSSRYSEECVKPVLVVVCGLTGSGKSSLADAIGKRLCYDVLSSDVTRKALAGISPMEQASNRFNKGIYSSQFSAATYAKLQELALSEIKSGRSVVVDATFCNTQYLSGLINESKKDGASTYIIRCTAPEDIIRARLHKRLKKREGPSDGTWEIYMVQKSICGKINEPFLTINTSGQFEETLMTVLKAILLDI